MNAARPVTRVLRPAPAVELLDLHAAHPHRYPHLLESAARGPHGRYDILFAFPEESLTLDAGHQLWFDAEPVAAPGFLHALDRWWRESREPASAPVPALPFSGGWFLFLGYELAAEVEPKLRLPTGGETLPVARATRFRTALIRDRVAGTLTLVAEPGVAERLAVMEADLRSLGPASPVMEPPSLRFEEDEPEGYLDAVRRILSYIRDGDVFQVNLSRAWRSGPVSGVAPAAWYRRLRERNPGPFNGLASWPEGTVMSSSPERLVRVRGRRIDTRPIAGTRPRGRSASADRSLSAELLGHPKERAEHVMLIDLERNDLGRVCRPGSIHVDEKMTLESYAEVHHIVSNIQGELRADVTPGQVMAAMFPGGTITGCPKVRCMEIIAELEALPRGPYTGSMGYLNRDGSLDLNILIRTLVHSSDRIGFRAGAGIVADSDPEQELAETRAKARALVAAFES